MELICFRSPVSHGVDASEIEKSGVTKESLESHVQGKQQVYADEDFKDEFWHNARQPPLTKTALYEGGD